ncbi:MAG TPA: sodium pump decarboxylase subunit gamma [Ruminococcaceae bacterium]|nr:sodium pump decarboxylase subunit gamma [Oscillospiraceae bacterium]
MNVDWQLAWSTIFTGFAVVFAALIGLSLLVYIVGKIFDSINGKNKPEAPKNAETPKPVSVPVQNRQMIVQDGVDDDIIAVIAAAVAAMTASTGKAYAIKSVKRAKESRPVWGFAGMQQNTMPF